MKYYGRAMGSVLYLNCFVPTKYYGRAMGSVLYSFKIGLLRINGIL